MSKYNYALIYEMGSSEVTDALYTIVVDDPDNDDKLVELKKGYTYRQGLDAIQHHKRHGEWPDPDAEKVETCEMCGQPLPKDD